MNVEEQVLCEYQADILIGLCESTSCGSAYLVQRYLHSGVAKDIDAGESFALSVPQAIAAVKEQYPSLDSRGGERYPLPVMEWIGYITRCYALMFQVESRNILHHFSVRLLLSVYDAFHTLSPIDAAERIHGIYLETHPKESDYDIAKRILGPKYRRMLMNKKQRVTGL